MRGVVIATARHEAGSRNCLPRKRRGSGASIENLLFVCSSALLFGVVLPLGFATSIFLRTLENLLAMTCVQYVGWEGVWRRSRQTPSQRYMRRRHCDREARRGKPKLPAPQKAG